MKRGFTLIEVLFSLAISAIVMVGACVLMFNMSSILERFEEEEPFDVHVNGVEVFLKSVLKNSQMPDSRDYTNSFAAFAENANLGKGNPPDSMMGDKSKICFGVMDDIPFFLSRRGFSPEKDAWLDFREKDGLYIIWTFAKNENYNSASDDRPIYESLVSPFVVSMSYVYIDDDGRWLEEEDMDYVSSSSVASNQMPNFIKLVFERGKETHTRYISLLSNVDGEFAPGGSSAASSRNNSSNGGGNSSSGGEGGNGGGNVNRPSGARPGGGANGGAPSGGGSGGAK
ncbi:MAG: prepilin-type N-terminal cleavage/methylation domain-containing protein [Opitutales bacterium]|nr:prepilin-type N-terminal cleavage/methylation domain-containing protein [Opitutales bacterium]